MSVPLLSEYPNPLEFSSYMLFYGSVASGPVYCIREYIEFQDHSVFRRVSTAQNDPVNHVEARDITLLFYLDRTVTTSVHLH